MSKVLIIDDETKIARLLSDRIAGEGHEVETFPGGEEALPAIEKGDVDIVLCDLRLGGMDGLELLRRTKKSSPATDFVMMTAYASSKTAVEAMREGAYEYLIKPFQMDEVLLLMKRIQERRDLMTENLLLRERISEEAGGRRIVGDSEEIARVREMIAKVAPTDSPVLIQGESGTGKELVAAEIHEGSARRAKPFVVINCAAVPGTLLEAELFGHEKGAFTGAVQRKPGQFKLAHTGTLFLDEIGELPPVLQPKILRAIENGEFLPLGSARAVTVDVRIVAATNRNLDELVREGSFREDLFYRLNVFPITLPPLRARTQDIEPITAHFLGQWKIPRAALGAPALSALRSYGWPGNVRELRNILERAVILAGGGPITAEHITITGGQSSTSPEERIGMLIGEKTLPEIERTMVELALQRAGGNKSRAAELLGITRRTLYGRLERYGLAGDAGSSETESGHADDAGSHGDETGGKE